MEIKTHYKPTETFQFTHFASCHPPGVKYGFIKGEAMRLLRTNSSKETYEEGLLKFKESLKTRRYPENIEKGLCQGSTLSLDNRLLLHIHKSQKVTNVYCLLSQRTTRQLKI